jgi:hypothetical protein
MLVEKVESQDSIFPPFYASVILSVGGAVILSVGGVVILSVGALAPKSKGRRMDALLRLEVLTCATHCSSPLSLSL